MFEDFSLCTSVAGDCDIKINTQTSGACPYVVSAGPKTWNVFLSSMTDNCTTSEASDGIEDGAYNGICYHVPFDESLFNS